jgi:hypothetical protein
MSDGQDTASKLLERSKFLAGFSFNIIGSSEVVSGNFEQLVAKSISAAGESISADCASQTGEFADQRRLIISAEVNVMLVDWQDEDADIQMFYEEQEARREEDSDPEG